MSVFGTTNFSPFQVFLYIKKICLKNNYLAGISPLSVYICCFSFLDQDLQHFPHVKMKLKVQRKDTDGDRSRILSVRLEKTNSRRHSSRAFVPRFPKVSFSFEFFLMFKYIFSSCNLARFCFLPLQFFFFYILLFGYLDLSVFYLLKSQISI